MSDVSLVNSAMLTSHMPQTQFDIEFIIHQKFPQKQNKFYNSLLTLFTANCVTFPSRSTYCLLNDDNHLTMSSREIAISISNSIVFSLFRSRSTNETEYSDASTSLEKGNKLINRS